MPADTCIADCPDTVWCPGCAACPCVPTCDPGCPVAVRPAPHTVTTADIRTARTWDTR